MEVWKNGIHTSPEDQRPFDIDISPLARVDVNALQDFQMLSKAGRISTSPKDKMPFYVDTEPLMKVDANALQELQTSRKVRSEVNGNAAISSPASLVPNTGRRNSWDSMLAEDISVIRPSDSICHHSESLGVRSTPEGVT